MRATRTTRHLLILFYSVFAVSIAGCATRPSTPPTRAWSAPCDTCMAGVENFGKVTPLLWRGEQPTKEGFRHLEAAGVKTVISLREFHDDLPLLKGTKLKYLRIPMDPWRPEEEELIQFLKAVDAALKDPDGAPVFVHCSLGRDRTGYSIASYRMVFEHWAAEDAIHEMFDFRFNAIFFYNPRFLKKMDVERLRTLVQFKP
ncbi:MAG: dual specificity protein phosphatase family protein [Nitrospirae bacterium]|nr:dual specificity protein phosphatase family protein [Candidatus Manganitrophaceae bacterium]